MQQSIHSNSFPTNCYLHISINNIQIRHNKPFNNVYFSFVHKDKFYFSSTVDQKTAHVNDDIVICFQHEDQLPDFVKLQRWENHVILLEHQVDITQVRTRFFTKKKIETKQHEIISLTIHLCTSQQMRFFNFPINQIIQHYLKITKLTSHGIRQTQNDISYFQVLLKKNQQKYTVPVTNSQLVIKLPCDIQIMYFKNNCLVGKTDWLGSKEFVSKVSQLGLYDQKHSYVSKIRIHLQWGANLSFRKLKSSILYEANQLCIYDIEVKFENFSQLSNSKLKFVYGNKGFQIIGELNHRVVLFQRIIYLILKSQQEEVAVYCERMNKVIAEARFNTSQMLSHKVVTVKKYFTDPVSHRPLGYVKFLCEKAKNLSLPSSNNFWKEFTKKKNPSKLFLRIQQLSVESPSKKTLFALIKTEKQQYQIDPIINISNSQVEVPVHDPLLIGIQQRLSMYMVIKQRQQPNSVTSEGDFLGIAAINYQQLRLGANPVKIAFFKNQQQTVQANCIINKIVPYPFVKGILQNEMPISPHLKTYTISVDICLIRFEPYFYTFQYERKTQVYCIFEIGKLKKVMVLQKSNQFDLTFQITNGSDALNFLIAQTDFIKGKLTFLVSSLGMDQEVYGWSTIKLKALDFMQKPTLKFDLNPIKNEQGIFIGQISLQIKKGLGNSTQLFSNKEIKKIKNEMIRVNENIEKVQRSFSKNKSIFLQQIKTPNTQRRADNKKSLPMRYVSRRRNSPEIIKLPKI